MNDGVGAGFERDKTLNLNIGEYDKISGLGQRTRSQFSGPIIGGKLSHKNGDSENVLIFDFYPAVKYYGKQFWPQRGPGAENWKLRDAQLGYGFKVGLEHYFKVNNQTLKLFSSFESIKINKLIQSQTSFINKDGDVDYVVKEFRIKGGDADSVVKGNVNYNSVNMGLGFYF